jgi:hypothetical protein
VRLKKPHLAVQPIKIATSRHIQPKKLHLAIATERKSYISPCQTEKATSHPTGKATFHRRTWLEKLHLASPDQKVTSRHHTRSKKLHLASRPKKATSHIAQRKKLHLVASPYQKSYFTPFTIEKTYISPPNPIKKATSCLAQPKKLVTSTVLLHCYRHK